MSMTPQQRSAFGVASVWGVVTRAAATANAQAPTPGTPPVASAPDGTTPAPRDEALAHFEKGKALYKADSPAAALAEFLESRRLYPTRNATNNAALCLVRLQRFDEAL